MIACTCFALPLHADNLPRIAIIIDDLGYQRTSGERALRLYGPVTFAILPDTPSGGYLAKAAHARGNDVLLHLPLQAEEDAMNPAPGSLLLDMSRRQFATAFGGDFDSIPYAVGVNSHRGSLLTRHPGHMAWLMEELKMRDNLFFVDSFTTADSVALRIARENGVPAVKRDVFLDPDTTPGTLEREFARLKKIARRQGFAVGIGHPYPTTLAFLETALPTLAQDGYELVSISDLIAGQDHAVVAVTTAE